MPPSAAPPGHASGEGQAAAGGTGTAQDTPGGPRPAAVEGDRGG